MTAQLSLTIPPEQLPSGTAMKLLRKICFYAEKIDKETGEPKGHVIIKIETFAKWLDGICERHVYRLLAVLERMGFIERVPHPGHKTAIYPLIYKWQIPGWMSHVPKPIAPRSKPMMAEVPQSRMADVNAGGSFASAAAKNDEKASVNMLAMSGVLAGSTSSFSSINIDKREKKYARNREKHSFEEELASLPEDAAPVVALMQKCGVWREKIAHYIRTFGVGTLYDSFSVTLRRIETGKLDAPKDDSAGYALTLARRVKSGEWKLPAWWLAERSAAERKNEREHARENRTVNPHRGKAPVPPDWLPGIPEEEARRLLRSAYTQIRYATGYDPDPASIVLRDQARVLWRKKNPAAKPPWEYIAETQGTALKGATL